MRAVGSKTLYLRAVATAVFLAATATTGCGPDDTTSVEGLAVDEITPDAIAQATEGVTSGRMELVTETDSGRSESSGRFDGRDHETQVSYVGPGSAPVTAARSITVDGRAFVPVDMFEVGGPSDERDEVRWVESPASPNTELPGGAGSESEFFEDPFGTMLAAMGEAASGASPEDLEGEQLLRYTVELSGEDAVALSDRMGVISPGVLPKAGNDERGVAVRQYREDHTEAEVTALVDRDGALLEIAATIVVDTDEFASCALLPDAGTFSVRMWDLDEPQSIEAPPADQVVLAEEWVTGTTWQEPAGEPVETDPAAGPSTRLHTTSTTVVGGPVDTFQSVDGHPVAPGGGQPTAGSPYWDQDTLGSMTDELFSGCPT